MAGIPASLLAAVLVAVGALGFVVTAVVAVIDHDQTRSLDLPLAWCAIGCLFVCLLGVWVLA
jgi:hypothetical protein